MTIHTGDCIEVMAGMPADSVDAVVTDPPYGLEFMGKGWDKFGAEVVDAAAQGGFQDGNGGNPFSRSRVRFGAGKSFMEWCEAWGREALRVTKPGGYLLAFGGTRTHHRLVCGLEDAGWIIRDELDWIYASGFPKSLDVGKAMDKRRDDASPVAVVASRLLAALQASGKMRRQIDEHFGTANVSQYWFSPHRNAQIPPVDRWLWLREFLGIDDADLDNEVWRLNGRKGTWGNERADREVGEAADNIIYQPSQRVVNPGTPATELARKWDGWGTALKPAHEPIVLARKPLIGSVAANVTRYGTGALNIAAIRIGDGSSQGRWPSNVLLDPDYPELFDEPNPYVVGSGATTSTGDINPYEHHNSSEIYGGGKGWRTASGEITSSHRGDSGGYSRFFIVPKSSRSDREPIITPDGHDRSKRFSTHPTQKPTDLMAHLIRLVCPPDGVILDPFLGSGSTAVAAEREGVKWIGIEKEPEYVAIAEARLNGVQRGLGLDVGAPTKPRKSIGMQGPDPNVIGRKPTDSGYSGGWTGTAGTDEEPAA